MPNLTRRRFLLTAAAALAAAPVTLVDLGSEPAANLPLSALAWQRVADQSEWYKGQLWKEQTILADEDRRRANGLRWQLGLVHCYPLVCYPDHPLRVVKRPYVEANQRAALVTLVEALSGEDLQALFEVAQLLDEFPMDAEERAELGERQRRWFEPFYARSLEGGTL
jgi:hypothetical protein